MNLFNDKPLIKGATFSDCKKYRFALWREWDINKPLVQFIGLNPSTADAENDDPTIKSVVRLAKYNGFGGVYMTNCFPIISTDPKVLIPFYESGNPYEQHKHVENIEFLKEINKKCMAVVMAWGNFDVVKQTRMDRFLQHTFPEALCLGINKNGSPKHPLYIKTQTTFLNYDNPRNI